MLCHYNAEVIHQQSENTLAEYKLHPIAAGEVEAAWRRPRDARAFARLWEQTLPQLGALAPAALARVPEERGQRVRR